MAIAGSSIWGLVHVIGRLGNQAGMASKPTGQFMALQHAATAAEHDLSIDRLARRDLDLAYA